MRTLARRLGTTLAVAGVLLVIYAGMVVFWRDPVTSIYTAYEQHAMSGQLSDTFDSWQATAQAGARRLRSTPRRARTAAPPPSRPSAPPR